MNAYFMSQFGYCPSVWLKHSRKLNNCISGLHKRALSLAYSNCSSGFPELLEKDKSATIHNYILQTLSYEIFKIKNNMVPEILTEIFPHKESSYSLRNRTVLQSRSIKTGMYDSETISSLGPKIWVILPIEFKNIVSPTLFKKKICEQTSKELSKSFM